ncbi:MAG: DUF2298 domain-containing protein [Thermomicrobiaceae bacterium]
MIPSTMSFPDRFTTPLESRFKIAVAVILVIAALLRFYGQDWDDGHYFHPDERFIATVMENRLAIPPLSEVGSLFDPASSPLNTRSNDENGQPRAFAYGSLPFLVVTFLGTVLGAFSDTDLLAYQKVGEFGRFLTTVVDLGTVAVVIFLARRVFSELAAIIAGLLVACSVVLIQLAHFFTVDTWVTFFSIATLYACMQIASHFSLRWILIAAAFGGAALATKVSVGVLGIPIIVAMVIGARQVSSTRRDAFRLFAIRLGMAAIPAVTVFGLFEPYAIWRPGPFIDDIRNQWEIVNGHYDVPFTRQFVGTISGLNEIENLVLWGIAPGFGIAALISVGIAGYLAIRTRDTRYILLLSWIIPYFFVIASSEARFLRYAAPLVPPLAVIVGHQLAIWWYRSPASWRNRLLPGSAIAIVSGITLAWAIAFMGVYTGPHPRVEASEWIYENVEPGATLTHEIWDDRLPVRLMAGSGEIYSYRGLDLYADRENAEAFDYIEETLGEADYIVLASQRLSDSIPRLPWRYPVQSAYYRLLEDEKLGFELAHEATNYPGFSSFRVNTSAADESFSVYDHPPVRIYRKVDELTRDELALRFAHAVAQPRIAQREPDEPTLRLLEPVSERSANTTAEWSSAATNVSPVAIALWLIAILAFVVIGIPISGRLFVNFPDQGAGFSPLIGLLGVGVLVWLVWSLELTRLTAWLVAALAILLGAGLWYWFGLTEHWRTILERRRWTLIGATAAFAIPFSVFLVIRAINPDLWHPVFGGEKPMETAYLNAILRTGEFPPHDPWFSGGALNYYYYGFFLLALVWLLTGIPSDIAFQLSVATIAGLLGSGLFSLGSALSSSILQTRRQRWIIVGGLITVATVMLTGNLQSFRTIIQEQTLNVDFWASSRVVEFAINEFTYFSLLYGDVHPHLIAAPVLVLVVALAYAWVQDAAQFDVGWAALWVAMAAIAAGSLAAINLWDAPTSVVLLGSALLFPLFRSRRSLRRPALMALMAAISTLALGYALFAQFYSRFAPQTGGFEQTSRGTGFEEWSVHFGGLLIPILAVFLIATLKLPPYRQLRFSYLALGAALATVSFLVGAAFAPDVSGGLATFVVSGVIVAITSALIIQSATRPRSSRAQDIALLTIAPFVAVGGALALTRPVAAAGSIIVAGFLALFWANRNRDSAILISIIGASAAGLMLVADVVYIADHLNGTDWQRMNTVFKLYFQSWTLLGIAAAAAIIWLAGMLHRALGTPRWTESGARIRLYPVRSLALIPGVIFVFALAAYPLFATGHRLDQRMESSPAPLSLSGNGWMQGGSIQNAAGETIEFSGDYEAINWFNAEVEGNPVILEASIGAYRGGGSRISSATGLPTVLGWESHQSQQRGGDTTGLRNAEVRELYRTADIERKRYLLHKYRFEYVIACDVERLTIPGNYQEGAEPDYYSGEAGLEAFNEMLGEDLEIAFQSGNTTVYRVLPFPDAGDSS